MREIRGHRCQQMKSGSAKEIFPDGVVAIKGARIATRSDDQARRFYGL
jgi:hypothetical protein